MFYIRELSPERTNTSNWGYRQTLPRGLPSEDQHIQQRIQTDSTQRVSFREGIQTDPTQRSSIREDQHIQQRRIQTDPTQRASIRWDNHQTTGNQKRKLTDTTSERNQQWQTREYQTAEQNTSIKVKYCKTTYLIRWFIVKTS